MPAPFLASITLLRYIVSHTTQSVDAHAKSKLSNDVEENGETSFLSVPFETMLAATPGATEITPSVVVAYIRNKLGPDFADVVITPAAPPAPPAP